MGLKALGEQGAGLSRAPGRKGEDRQAAADLAALRRHLRDLTWQTDNGGEFIGELQPDGSQASGVLHGGPVKGLHLRPVVRDIVEIRGVGGDLGE